MTRTKWLLLCVFALLLSGLVTFLLYRVVQARLRPVEQTVQIVVAAQRLPLGTRLSDVNVKMARWPKAIPLEGSFMEAKQVIGRGVIVALYPNEPIIDAKLAPKEAGAGLPAAIPDGMRAVSVKVNDVIGVAGFVLPGTHVDVIMIGAPKANEDVASRVILENVLVLSAGQNVEQDVNGKPQNVQVVTLMVTPEQSQDLALAGVDGRIQLALRNPLDSELKDPSAVQRTTLFNRSRNAPAPLPEKPVAVRKRIKPKPAPQAVSAAPVAPGPPDRVVEVELILGQKKETVTFVEKKQ